MSQTKNTKVAIQGIEGSFHHIVAKEYFGEKVDISKCDTFDQLIDELKTDKCLYGVMAIENSIAGSILPNYSLVDFEQMTIVGEHLYSISHNLVAMTGQSITDIEEVHSHPMALLQCKRYFQKYPHIRLVEAHDTAEEAKRIADQRLSGFGAIASREATELFGLSILGTDIQTIKRNITRFIIVQKKNRAKRCEKINKVSMKFMLSHQRGSLATVLNLMSDCQLNLTKIQSLPVIETPGKYAFFVDVVFEEYHQFVKARKIIEIVANHFKILGEYTDKKYDRDSR